MPEEREPAPRRGPAGRLARPSPPRGHQPAASGSGGHGHPRRSLPAARGGGRPTRPRTFGGGVQSGVGENWWTARWLAALERLGWSTRLQPGQGYARGGNVLRIDVQPGVVTATVKGSQPKPYRVIIRTEPLTDSEWERVIDVLASQALFAARLLAGEMPTTIEDAFASAGVTLFPLSTRDLYAACSCPDWNNPCKHVAAVHYMLGAEFDRDPFLLFWLRGRSRQQLIDALRQRRVAGGADSPPAEATDAPEPEPEAGPVPLEDCLDHFWQLGPGLAGERAQVVLPEVPESVLRRLGPPPFWRGDFDLMPILVDAYRTISREAHALAHPELPVVRPALPPPDRPAPERRAPAEPAPLRPLQPARPRRPQPPSVNGARPRPEAPVQVPLPLPEAAEAVAAAENADLAGQPRRNRRRWWPRRGRGPAAPADE